MRAEPALCVCARSQLTSASLSSRENTQLHGVPQVLGCNLHCWYLIYSDFLRVLQILGRGWKVIETAFITNHANHAITSDLIWWRNGIMNTVYKSLRMHLENTWKVLEFDLRKGVYTVQAMNQLDFFTSSEVWFLKKKRLFLSQSLPRQCGYHNLRVRLISEVFSTLFTPRTVYESS